MSKVWHSFADLAESDALRLILQIIASGFMEACACHQCAFMQEGRWWRMAQSAAGMWGAFIRCVE